MHRSRCKSSSTTTTGINIIPTHFDGPRSFRGVTTEVNAVMLEKAPGLTPG